MEGRLREQSEGKGDRGEGERDRSYSMMLCDLGRV